MLWGLIAAANAAGIVAPPEELPAAAPRSGLVVEVSGQCPSRQAVMAALRPVVGNEPTPAGTEAPRVADLGDRFEIAAFGQTRQYDDGARDCAERARVAAV